MTESITVDAIFLDLCKTLQKSSSAVDIFLDLKPDPIWNFYDLLIQDKPLTKNQADYVLKILRNYKDELRVLGYDLDEVVKNPKWKHPFRILDQTKKISVEQDEDGVVWYCFQFPYSLKDLFDTTFDLKNSRYHFSKWDPNRKVRKVKFYQINFLEVDTFINQHNFIIDDSYLDIKAQVEEIINSQDTIEKISEIVDGQVKLKNASPEAEEYFQKSKNSIIEHDLLLAKTLGHLFECGKTKNIFEKISSSRLNHFWAQDFEIFFSLYEKLQEKACIVLDQEIDYKKWINEFLIKSDAHFISRNQIKVCFREDKNSEFNKWIKENNVGGKISEGSIYIFLNTPAKWLYEDINSVKMLVMTDIIPNSNRNVQHLMAHHPLVLYLNNKKPTTLRDIKIVSL